jgi:membrane-bound lytic murein transglycosylase D
MKVYDLITVGQVYYLESKRRKGRIPYHIVKDGETMWVIAQNYGIRIKHLLRKNRMDQAEKLKAGRVIWLKKDRPVNEPIEYRNVPPPPKLVPRADPPTVYNKPKPPVKVVPEPVKKPVVQPNPPVVIPKVLPYKDLTTSKEDSALRAQVEAAKIITIKTIQDSTKKDTLQTKGIERNEKPVVMPVDTAQPGAKLPPVPRFQEYELLPGETLLGVAEKVKAPLDSIIIWNRVNDSTILKPGVLIRYRPAEERQFEREARQKTITDSTKSSAIKADSVKAKAILVQPAQIKNDSVKAKPVVVKPLKAAAKTDSTVKQVPQKITKPIVKADSIGTLKKRLDTIKVKDSLKTTIVKPVPENTTPNEFHIVAPGESLYRISKKYNLSVEKLLELNHKTSNAISVGEKLLLK